MPNEEEFYQTKLERKIEKLCAFLLNEIKDAPDTLPDTLDTENQDDYAEREHQIDQFFFAERVREVLKEVEPNYTHADGQTTRHVGRS